MPVETHLDGAIERVDDEQEAVAAKRAAFDDFIDRIESLAAEPGQSTPAGVLATAGSLSGQTTATENRCRRVRKAFAETVRPHSVDDVQAEPLIKTIEAELSPSVAGALASTPDSSFSPTLKRAVLSAATTRRAETEVFGDALGYEADQLETARDTVETITTWIAEADETPLRELGFDALRDRHETLSTHRAQCDRLAEHRQQFLRQSTNRGVDSCMDHRELVSYLYQEFPVDFPVLSAATRLAANCTDCQRAVRRHLVRRG